LATIVHKQGVTAQPSAKQRQHDIA